MTERGQTAYDYLLGIVLLLVTIITVLSLFPQLFGPFVDPVSTDQQKMSERMASEIIDANSTVNSERTVDLEAIEQLDDQDIERLKKKTGIPELRNVNITVQSEPGMIQQSAGDGMRDSEPTAVTVRQIRSPTGTCQSGCQFIVRVW